MIRPGMLTADDAAQLNRALEVLKRLERLTVTAPLELRDNVISLKPRPPETAVVECGTHKTGNIFNCTVIKYKVDDGAWEDGIIAGYIRNTAYQPVAPPGRYFCIWGGGYFEDKPLYVPCVESPTMWIRLTAYHGSGTYSWAQVNEPGNALEVLHLVDGGLTGDGSVSFQEAIYADEGSTAGSVGTSPAVAETFIGRHVRAWKSPFDINRWIFEYPTPMTWASGVTGCRPEGVGGPLPSAFYDKVHCPIACEDTGLAVISQFNSYLYVGLLAASGEPGEEQMGAVTTTAQSFAGTKTFKDGVIVENGLGISGGILLSGGITVSSGGTTVTGNSSVTGTWAVTGTSIFGNTVTISSGGLSVTGNVGITGDITFSGSITGSIAGLTGTLNAGVTIDGGTF